MSSQSSVYTEKKIAAYESLFKESNFAKPQEVYLTITVAHVFGQAYILEQEGTKEGDPVYSRFVCPLEEITKVYVNDKIKKPWPLFIQCDTNVKGVIHRKRIVIPCLNDPTAIADQINEVKALHMQKYEAAIERENQRKRAELENARMQEQIANEAKSKILPLPAVDKLPDPIPESPVIPAPTPAPETKKKAAPEAPKSIKSAKALTNELEDSFKALESIDSAKSDIKPLPKKPVFDFDDFDKVFSAAPKAEPKAEAAEKPAAEAPAPKPKAESSKKPKIVDLNNINEAIAAMPKQTKKKAEKPAEPAPKPVVETVPEPVVETAPEPVIEAAPEPVVEAAPEPVIEAAPEPVIEAVPEPAPAPAPKPARVNPIGKTAELSEFESAVIVLKEKRDSGEITEEQYVSEKKKLISTLY